MERDPSEPVQEPAVEPEVSEHDAELVDALEDDDTEVVPSFSWQASEFLHHQKNTMWYLGCGVVTAILIGVAAVTKQWFSIPVFAVMGVAMMMYAAKTPRVLDYALDDHGIAIGGKHYLYNQFRDFAVITDVGWHSIDLDPLQRFMPRLSIIFDDKDFNTIVGILSQRLPRVERTPDWVESLMRRIKF